MSFNQPRPERSESFQYRKSNRSGTSAQPRNLSGGIGKGGGGPAPPASSTSTNSSLSSNRSFKKSNNAQGGQSRVSSVGVNPDPNYASAARTTQNGARSQPSVHGAADAPLAWVPVKPTTDMPTQKITQAVPKAPSSQPAIVNSDSTPPATPAKGEASKSFPLQSGSMSPGFVNGMQIPAQTNSAPPNLDEQQRDQVRHNSRRTAQPFPIPSVPKKQLPRKDGDAGDQSNTGEAHQMSKPKGDVQFSSASPVTQTQKTFVHHIPGVSMPMPFHQPQVPVQLGGPKPPIQLQGMAAPSLPVPMPMHMSMPLPMGNAQLQQSVFVANLQPHPMQPQGIMHQGQSLNFPPQMGPRMPSQLGNLGISIGPPFAQHQAGKYSVQRKPVKITHPDTHEELRPGGSSGTRSHPNVPQSQPIPSIPPAQSINYYSNSYKLFLPSRQAVLTKSVPSDVGEAPVSAIPSVSEPILENEGEGTEYVNDGLVSLPPVASNDKPVVELSRSKSNVFKGKKKGKKKRKEFLQKADALGTTSNLYMAYMGPAENNEIVASLNSITSTCSVTSKHELVDTTQDDIDVSKGKKKGKKKRKEFLQKADALGTASDLYMAYKGPEEKNEIVASLNSITSTSGVTSKHELVDTTQDDIDVSKGKKKGKKKRKEILQKADAYDIDVNDGLVSLPAAASNDKPVVELTRSKSNVSKGKKKRKEFLQKADALGTTSELVDTTQDDIVLKKAGQHKSEPDDWEDAADVSIPRSEAVDDGKQVRNEDGNGLMTKKYSRDFLLKISEQCSELPEGLKIPSYAEALMAANLNASRESHPSRARIVDRQVMHKAEKKYEVGKITDEEVAKQRRLKAILNKLTPQNFEKLFEQVKEVNIDNTVTLTGVISQIFDKALMEPTFCEMYANFCYYLAGELPDFSEDNEKITFKRLLLNKCQEEFERDAREQEEADRADDEGDVKLSEGEREEKRIQARRRMLGNIRLIGELYKKKMLTEKIMHECIKQLLGEYQNPDEEDIEALCKLMSTIGEMIDHPKAKPFMDAYFDRMAKLSNNMNLSSRLRFMLKDSIDLRKNKWQQRRKVEGPKKIEEVHRDAAQERHVQAGRLARAPSINSRSRQPMDFSPRGSGMLSSPNMGSLRGLPPQPRGYGIQDARLEDRHPFENRVLSVPLPQRPTVEDSITLGPQGGLARGMSSRGQPPMPTSLNGYSQVSEKPVYSSREDLMPRHTADRFGPSHDHLGIPDRNVNFGNRELRNADRTVDRSRPISPIINSRESRAQSISSDKMFPEERLRDMSIAAIKEFYSAKDEKEVAFCVKELNAPSFYPTMISIWVTDSFERKDMERDLLAKLLIKLSTSQDAMLNGEHLIKGFESVLGTLEDAVNDAPKAGEFLGRIFAKIIIENVIPFTEIGQLIQEGGEERGSLVEMGLAAEVVGTILETIKSEKGDSVLNEIRSSSSLKIEKFRPPNSKKPLRLDKFI